MVRNRSTATPSFSADDERSIICDRGLLLFDGAHVAPSRPLAEPRGELRELPFDAYGVDFDASVIQVAGVAVQAELSRRALREVSVTDALHTAADEPAAGLLRVL